MVFLIKGLWKAKLGHNAVKGKNLLGNELSCLGK
jgi:hypothetical protein